MSIFFGTLLSTVIFALLTLVVKEGWKGVVALVAVLINAGLSSWITSSAFRGESYQEIIFGGHIYGNIPLRIDPLSAWFILIVNLTCINGALFGIGYMKTYNEQKTNLTLHWILFLIFQTSMLWVCMLQHGLAFLIAWELMSVSSLLLIMFEHYRADTVKAGVNYLVQMHIAVVFLSLGFMWVYFSEGSFDFSAIPLFFLHNKVGLLFLLFFIGFGFKAGFIPLHTWLPHAHPAAPSHISGVMSGVIVKLGIYGILRIVMYLNCDLLKIGEFILILSILTAFYGILNASVHRDFKQMLAFCTIENIGIIGTGIGLGMIGKSFGNQYLMFIGFAGALLHTLNHSLYKSLLFFTAGNIYQQTHTRNMEHLGGLIKKMPNTAFFFLAGALAICGLPPLNGFVSEFLIYSGLIEGIKSDNIQFSSLMILCISGMSVVGGISMLTFTKSFGTIFLGSPRTVLEHQPKEVSVIMRLPLYIIFSIMLFIGIFPNLILIPIFSIITIFSTSTLDKDLFLPLSNTLSLVGRFSLLLFLFVMVVYLIRRRITSHRTTLIGNTWGCGYGSPNVRMQYTGKSYSKTLAKLFNFITIEKKKYIELDAKTIFPKTKKYYSHYAEFFESLILDKINKQIIAFFNYFTFIHNGKIQMYVLYGFFFIILLIVATFINLL